MRKHRIDLAATIAALRPRLLPLLLLAALGGCSPGGNDSHGQPASAVTGTTDTADGSPRTAVPGGAADSNPAPQQSSNWSGYVQNGGHYTRIAGSWIVPAVHCADGARSSSATWTGIGGGTTADPTLIQAGTDQSCDGGPSYSAWWELVPAPSIGAGEGLLDTQDYPVSAGDRISVSIDSSTLLGWTISIHNATRGWNYNTTAAYASAGATAEWIEEAPLSAGSDGAGQTELSDFGRVAFSALSVNGANPQLSSSQRMAMVDASGSVIANPSAPAASGDAFAVCFGAGACQ